VSKKSKSQISNGAASPATATNGSHTEANTQPKKPRKAAPKTARKPVAKKTSTKKSAFTKRVRSTSGAGPSDADIRIRAYFIAEQRARLSLPGDPSNDWLEARRQLMEEGAAGQS
jgi:hypothetical protein